MTELRAERERSARFFLLGDMLGDTQGDTVSPSLFDAGRFHSGALHDIAVIFAGGLSPTHQAFSIATARYGTISQ
jgi:hypothetical protein